jgi:hypothetical protein
MKAIFRTLLNILLLVGLIVAPVTVSLASVQGGAQLPTQVSDSEACHHTTQQMGAAILPASMESMSCTCYVDDCTSMDNGGCQHSVVSPLIALPGGAVRFPLLVRDQLAIRFQDSHSDLSIPPESPPPIV